MFGSNKRLEKKLRENGRQATARILEVNDTGMTVSDGSGRAGNVGIVYKLKLSVEPPGEPAFEAKVKQRFSQFSTPVQGMSLNVLYDPDDHGKVAIDTENPVASIGGTVKATTTVPGTPGAGTLDLNQLIASAQALGQQYQGDPHALAEKLKEQFPGVSIQEIHASGVVPGLPGAGAAPAGAPAEDPLDRLEKLGHLKEEGILTEEEFQEQKRKLLGES